MPTRPLAPRLLVLAALTLVAAWLGAPAAPAATAPAQPVALPPTGILDLHDTPAWTSRDPAALTGLAVASVGDFDGDGRPDVAIGAPREGAGVVRVVPGGAGGGDLATAAIAIRGAAAADRAGTALAPAGDVNRDGRADLLIGAPGAGPSGAAYLVFGRAGSAAIDLATDPDVVRLAGSGEGSRFGTAVSAIGDLDGDGVPELVVGAPKQDAGDRGRAGAVYVIHGRTTGGTVDPGTGWRLDGPASGGAAGALFGQSVGAVDDLNGDGRPELLAGAPRAGDGEAYVIWGRPDAAVTDVGALGIAGVTIARGAGTRDWLGGSIAAVGDVNGDHVPDLGVGAQLADAPSRPDAGAAFVVYGRRTPGRVDVDKLGDDHAGYRIDGAAAGDFTGTVVARAGDLNADGHPDVLVSAPFASPSGRTLTGAVYVVFGGDAQAAPLDLGELGDRALRITGAEAGDTTGAAAVGAGDLDGDRGDDLVLGAPHLSGDYLLSERGTGPGAVRVVHGTTPAAAAAAATDGPAAIVADPGYAEALRAGCRVATNVEALIEDNDYTDEKADPARIRRDALEAFVDDPRNAGVVLGVARTTPVFEPTVLGPAAGPRLGRALADAVDGQDDFPGYESLIASLGVVNPAAQARILLVDGYLFRDLASAQGLTDGNPPTYVIAVGRPPNRNAADIRQLTRLAHETDGGLYRAENPREIERAFQRIESHLRCDLGAETDHDEIYPGDPEVLAEDEVEEGAETADVEVNWRDPDEGFEIAEVDVVDRKGQVVRRIGAAAVQKAYRLNARGARRAAVVGGRGRTFRQLHLRRVRAGTRIRVTVRAQKGSRGGRVYGRITQSRMRR